jgi:anionic cell wall polymer biosynthesis LytR-Cps2A-Psr (LCP) family protein
MTMDAVKILNDLVGGVTLKVLDDLSHVDPALVKDETLTLTGDQALKYVRNRYGLADSSNVGRMDRQRQYINGLYEKTVEYAAGTEDFSSTVLLQLSEYLVSNLSVSHAENLLDTIASYTKKDVHSIKGESVLGEKYMEFYPDKSSIESIVIELFYKVKE